MRYDLAFFLCCCKSFLGDDPSEESFYDLLGVDPDATQDEIKRAYKRQSLQMHPDKLAQKGKTVTPQDQAAFTRMKEAYEVLSDAHRRDTYDAIGERGMKWMDEPFSMDPQELAHNFANSSAYDRSKIFSIFVVIAAAILMLPTLVCLHVDGVFGRDASWLATLTPLWMWDAFVLFYHTRVILMGPITRPDHIPEHEWVDPLPMKKRIFSLIRFVLVCLFEILVALKLDAVLGMGHVPWFVVFFPLYLWEATTLYKKWPLARMRIVTVEDLETALGKPFSEFTAAEKELIGKRYSVVPSINSPDFEAAQKLKTRARHDIIKSLFRVVFVVFLLVQLDSAQYNIVDGTTFAWNWWAIFSPFWIMTLLICYANYQAFAEVQAAALKKDPTLFGSVPPKKGDVENGEGGTATTTGYGAVGTDGNATTSATAGKTDQEQTQQQSPLSEEEREELKATLMASSSRLCSKCCSQGFLLFVVILFVAKLQGAGFSSLWIISPFLLIAGIILLCLGCAIFGITEVPTDGVEFDTADFGYASASAGASTAAATATGSTTAKPSAGNSGSSPPIVIPPPPAAEPAPAMVSNYAPPPQPSTETNRSSSNPIIIPVMPEAAKETAASINATPPLTTSPTPSAPAVASAGSASPVVVPVMAAIQPTEAASSAAASTTSITAASPSSPATVPGNTATSSSLPRSSTAPTPSSTTASAQPIDLLDDGPTPASPLPEKIQKTKSVEGGGDGKPELHDLD